MGRSQKQKGNRREREFAKLIGGSRIPLSGQAKHVGEAHAGDVVDSRGIRWEVKAKAREDGFKMLYRWLEPDHIDALAVKGDRKEWLVVLPLPLFLSLLGDRKDDPSCGSGSNT